MKKKKRKNKAYEAEEMEQESDEYFYFIAGYTNNGIPFGITWEQAIEEGLVEGKPDYFSDEIPF